MTSLQQFLAWRDPDPGEDPAKVVLVAHHHLEAAELFVERFGCPDELTILNILRALDPVSEAWTFEVYPATGGGFRIIQP